MAQASVRRFGIVAILGLVLVVSAGALGCGSAADEQATTESPTAMSSSMAQAGEDDVQTCSACAGGEAGTVPGETETVDGEQVLNIGVQDGFYSPNQFTVEAGVPVKVVFSGKAKGCLAMPTFPSLEKKADFTSGEATLELGALEPGTYEFTCGMEMTGGQIVAQ
jgi:plastocyanin